tara:strand:- start:185 stop:373 length:189 start_codon:yes stop_codon:yes gene_type:complete
MATNKRAKLNPEMFAKEYETILEKKKRLKWDKSKTAKAYTRLFSKYRNVQGEYNPYTKKFRR